MLANSEEQDKRKIRSIEQPIPLSAIRLVTAIRDPETGIPEDVVCETVHATRPFFDKKSTNFKGAKVSYKRYIIMPDGTATRIPWPQNKAPKEHKDYPSDTLRMEVEQKSFIPTLLRPPMPGTVIDELRNKYSIFRTRHDPEYIAAKMKEDEEKEEKKKLIEKMRTPLKEINRLERKMKKAKGKGKLTEEMLERIGQVIAKKRQLQLDAAGVSQEPGPEAVVA
jgi:large subunit ribosomal protein L24